MSKIVKLAFLAAAAAVMLYGPANAGNEATQIEYAKTVAFASACGASDTKIGELKESMRKFFSKTMTIASFPHVFTQATKDPDTVLRDSGLTCSQALMTAGSNAAHMDRDAEPNPVDQPDKEEQSRHHGRHFYAAVIQCHLGPDKEQLIETFRNHQIRAAFADRPGLQEVATWNRLAHAPFTGWSKDQSVNPRDCSDLLVEAGRASALINLP